MLLLRSANDKVARAFEKQRSVKNRQGNNEYKEAETNSPKPPSPRWFRCFTVRIHAARIETAPASNSWIGVGDT